MKIMRLWNKLPSIIKGLIVGMMIQIIGVMPLSMLIQKNVKILPTFPWALFVGLIFLWVFWKFLSGQKLFFSTSATRIDLSRTKKMQTKSIKWVLLSGFLLSITVYTFVLIGYMLTEVPLQRVELLTTFKTIPLWTSLSLLFMASLVTGVVEEMAWRGYMQRIIEQKHKVTTAILVVALVFTIIHFLPLPVWPLFFLGSLGWGFLAYYSNSIIPGIVFHTLIDLTFFIWSMFNLEKLEEILMYNVFVDGFNSLFKVFIVTAIISTILTIFSFMKLKKLKAYNTVYS
jgi:membrane protease YdiL (CAAX protease family)